MARTGLKVCCIESVEEARLAIAAGSGAVGLVSAMSCGPGVIEEELIAQIAAGVAAPVATFYPRPGPNPSGWRVDPSAGLAPAQVPGPVGNQPPKVELVTVVCVRSDDPNDP